MIMAYQDSSQEYLAQELEATERALQNALDLQERLNLDDSSHNLPKSLQLAQLEKEAKSLALAQAMITWRAQAPVEEDLVLLSEWCDRLVEVILEHPVSSVYNETYLPLYQYLFPSLVSLLRSELDTKPNFTKLVRQCQTAPETCNLAQVCYWILKLQQGHQAVLDSLGIYTTFVSPLMIIIREFFRPIVRRIMFHFLESSPDRVTTTRIDKLPEWLLSYLRDHLLDQDGPHDFIRHGLSHILSSQDVMDLSLCFWQEVVRLVEWVLCERQFFRHPDIAGPRSNPHHLYQCMEQFLLFDRTLRKLAPVHHRNHNDDDEEEEEILLGLMDTLVMADDELRQWWIDRERDAVFTTLFDNDDGNVPKPLANHVSPRAELFCALIRSVQWKASILTAPGIYLRQVAVPLCTRFVDALHDASTDLRNALCQPGKPVDLVANLYEWIEIINGTRLAALVLAKEGAWKDGMPAASQSDQDLARFGRSLERLVEVMIEEVASSFVETILMERAKFASYLMMASHLLASQEWDGDDRDLSAELKETRGVLATLHQVCHSILLVPRDDNDNNNKNNNHKKSGEELLLSMSERDIAEFAPRAIQINIMNRVADKLLEVALDIHDVTPQLWQEGSQIFARDVQVLIGNFPNLSLTHRLLDVVQLMTLPSTTWQGLQAAIGGLVGATDYLDIHDFSSDGTIYNEAMMMLRAKGLAHLELTDAISILNRRKD